MPNDAVIPRFMTRFLEHWHDTTRSEIKPATCSWVAACPHCKADADWFSSANTLTITYRMACHQCGEVEWSPSRADS